MCAQVKERAVSVLPLSVMRVSFPIFTAEQNLLALIGEQITECDCDTRDASHARPDIFSPDFGDMARQIN